MSDGTTSEAMCNQDDFFGREGCDDLIDRMDPVIFVGCIPIALVNAGKAVACFPPALPMEGAGVVEAGKDKAKSRGHDLNYGNFRLIRRQAEKNLAKSFFRSIFALQ